jgi:tetratricopeptide (TPR) repeat protein
MIHRKLVWLLVLGIVASLALPGPLCGGDELDDVLDEKDPFGSGGVLGGDDPLAGDPFAPEPVKPAVAGRATAATPDEFELEFPGLETGPTTGPVALDGDAQEVWQLLSALSRRVRERGWKALAPARVRALELELGSRVEGAAAGALGPVLRRRWQVLRAAASGAGVAELPLEEGLEQDSGGGAIGGLLPGEPAAEVRAAEMASRRREDLAGVRLDGLIYGPLPAAELLKMLGSGDESTVAVALSELRERGPGALFAALLPRLGEVRSAEAGRAALRCVGETGEPEDLKLLRRLLGELEAGGGVDPGLGDLDGAFGGAGLTGGLPAGLRETAVEAVGRMQGRFAADELLAGARGSAASLLAELGARHYQAGENRRAAECLRRAAALESDNPLHPYYRARALYKLGLFQAAHDEAGRALSIGPEDRRYHALQLGALRALGRNAEVVPAVLAALRSADSGSLKAYLFTQLAIEQVAAGQPGEALSSLRLARTGFVPAALEGKQAAVEADARLQLGQGGRALAVLNQAKEQGLGGPRVERMLARLVPSAGR